MAKLIKTYKGFGYSTDSKEAEARLKNYIDSLGEEPSELPDVSEENYSAWHCDYDFAGVKLLVLPTSIKRIGKCVFAQSKIENVIADGVELIDELAFYNTEDLMMVRARECKKLAATTENGTLTSGSDAFNHSAVRELELPSVEYVGRYAFYDMPYIERLDLPSVRVLEPHAIYGCERLKNVSMANLARAGYSIVTMNENLEGIDCPSLLERDRLAFHSNGSCKVSMPAGAYRTEVAGSNEHLDYSADILEEARRQENINYDYNYKGFCFNLVDSLAPSKREEVRRRLETEIDRWVDMGEIDDSKNKNANESGHDALANVKDIYVPARVRKIGDYAFAKCYELESIVAPAVWQVGDHAFYCDGAVRYVDLPKCVVLENDAFNGTGCDVASKSEGTYSKIFIPEVKGIGRHAFWQTGFRVVEAPNCIKLRRTAFEENEVLQRIVVKKIASPLCVNNNPELRELVASSMELGSGLYGCKLAQEILRDPKSEPGGDE